MNIHLPSGIAFRLSTKQVHSILPLRPIVATFQQRCAIERPERVALEEGKLLGQLVASTEDRSTEPSGLEAEIDHVAAELVQTGESWRHCLPGFDGPDGSWRGMIRDRDVMMIELDPFVQ